MMSKILVYLAYALIRVINSTYRYRFVNNDRLEKAKSLHKNGAYIFGIWHQNLVGGILCQTGNPHVCIVSPSKDGEFVATTLKLLGHVSARGSSSRGGIKAMGEMVKRINEGIPGAITVDGPRGPAHQPKKGIFEIARETGAPIVPYIVIAKNYWSFKKSWDQFRLPKPFTKLLVYYGDPMIIDQNIQPSDWPRLSAELTAKLNDGELAAVRELQEN